MTNEDKKCNDLTGKEWLQNSFSIWRDLTKTKEEKELKHPASYPVALCEKLIKTFSKNGANGLPEVFFVLELHFKNVFGGIVPDRLQVT